MDEETAKVRRENKACTFTSGGMSMDCNQVGQVRTKGEKTAGKDCKGSEKKGMAR